MASNSSSSSSSSCVIRPGLEDASLLTIQETHISQYIWNEYPNWVLVVRGKFSVRSRDEQIPAEIISYLEQAGFLKVTKLEFFLIEHILVSALVEHWRPKTYTFICLGGMHNYATRYCYPNGSSYGWETSCWQYFRSMTTYSPATARRNSHTEPFSWSSIENRVVKYTF